MEPKHYSTKELSQMLSEAVVRDESLSLNDRIHELASKQIEVVSYLQRRVLNGNIECVEQIEHATSTLQALLTPKGGHSMAIAMSKPSHALT